MNEAEQKWARLHFVSNLHALDLDETWETARQKLREAIGRQTSASPIFEVECGGKRVAVNASLVTHITEHERTPF